MKKILLLFMIFMISPVVANAQHIVKKGETMYSISRTHNMSLSDLIKLNPQHSNPNLIHIGDHVVTREGTKADQIIDYARSLQDVTTYVYGGKNAPTETDCSGWVQSIYKKFNVSLPRVSRDQARIGSPVTFQQLKKGDLMFFSTRADNVITHVGIYMGNDYWISNLSTKQDVEILSSWGSWTQKYFKWGTRVL